MTQVPEKTAKRATGAAAVTATLQGYADRGVFRGFTVRLGRNLHHHYQFKWLTRDPMQVTFEGFRGILVFRNLLPGIDPKGTLLDQIKEKIISRSGGRIPQHRRLDPRRARVAYMCRNRSVSLKISIKGHHHAYAVQKSLNLVNEIFLLLQEKYPDYLTAQFGFSAE